MAPVALTPEKKKLMLSGKHVGYFPLRFDDDSSEDAGVSIPDTIQLIPIGQWDHDLYGAILITMSDIREFVQNFNAGVRKGVFITAGHEGFAELPAQGWITSVEIRDTGLWGNVEWNELGKETLSDKQFKFFSPEFYRDYEDPQTHQLYRNVLTGGALTKSPYFKELEAVVFSDKATIKKFTDNNNTMDLTELLAKDKATLTVEEKAFVKEHKAELTPEQLESHSDVVADEVAPEAPAEEPVAPVEPEAPAVEPEAPAAEPEAPAATEEAEVAPEAPTAEAIAASEKVSMSAVELAHLRSMADKGAQAFKELEKGKIDTAMTALTFAEGNATGRFLPKSTDKLRAFYEGLNADQRLAFSTLINDLPKAQIFGEIGAEGAADGNASTEVEALVTAKMTASEKAGTPMTYSDALKAVMSENTGLVERYDSSLTPVRSTRK